MIKNCKISTPSGIPNGHHQLKGPGEFCSKETCVIYFTYLRFKRILTSHVGAVGLTNIFPLRLYGTVNVRTALL